MGEVSIVAIAIVVFAGFYVGLSNAAINRKFSITAAVLIVAIFYGLFIHMDIKTAFMTFGMLFVAGYAIPSFFKACKRTLASKFGSKNRQ